MRVASTVLAVTSLMVAGCGGSSARTLGTGSSTCGAHMPATVQIRWKLPAGARFRGHLTVGIGGPVLQTTEDPRRAPCPVIQAPA